MKIAMLEPLSVPKESIDYYSKELRNQGHEFISCFEVLEEEEKLERAQNADILIVTNGNVSNDIIMASDDLKLISVGFTGIDHLPKDLCIKRGVFVANSQGYATIPTAELALTLMLTATRNLIQTEQACRKGMTKAGFIGSELSNKTVGIVGTGMIGRQVAKLLKGFDVKLLGYDVVKSKEATELGIQYTDLETLFESSDFVTLHLPLLKSTKGLINTELINKMKSTAILVNCARGPVIDSKALVDALNNDVIRGAGVDVYEIEPPLPTYSNIFTAKNLITTPHIAFASIESMERRAKIVFDNIYSFIKGEPINIKY